MLRYGKCLSGRRAKADDEAPHAIRRYGLMPVWIGEVAIFFDRGFIGGLEGCAVLASTRSYSLPFHWQSGPSEIVAQWRAFALMPSGGPVDTPGS